MSTDKLLQVTRDGLVLRVYVQPGARRAGVVGIHQDRLKVAVTEPPDRGQANAGVLRLLAEVLHVPRTQIQLLRGAGSRQKDLLLPLETQPAVRAALAELLP